MSRCREENEKRLNAKVDREHFFLQSREGGNVEGLVADLGHDEGLRQRELLLSYHRLHIFQTGSPETRLEELCADKCPVDQQVIWSCACQWSQSIDDNTLEAHDVKSKINQ